MSLTLLGAPILYPSGGLSQYFSSSAAPTPVNDSTNSTASGGWGFVFRATKAGTLTQAGMYFNTVTTGATLNVAFKTVSTSTGLPTVTDYGGSSPTTVVVSTAGYAEATFSTGATVAAGDLVSVIFTHPATPGNMASGKMATAHAGFWPMDFPYDVKNAAGSSWAKGNSVSSGYMFAVGYSTTDYIPFVNSFPNTARNSLSISNASNPAMWGAKFTTTVPMRVLGFTLRFASGAWHNGSVQLLDTSNSVLATATIDANVLGVAASSAFLLIDSGATYNMVAGTYRVVFIPTTSTSIPLLDWEVASNGLLSAFPSGASWFLTTNSSATLPGTWTDSNTKIPIGLMLKVDEYDNGAAGGITPFARIRTGF